MTFWTRIVYCTSDLILAPTFKIKNALHQRFPRTKIEVIGRGVNYALFKPLNNSNQKMRLLYVGRVSMEKDLEQLLFLKKYDDFHLTIVGEGRDLHRIKETLPFATFKGNLQNGHLAREYGSSDIFVFPSRYEGCPNALLEATAARLAIVSSDIGGANDLIENRKISRMIRSFSYANSLEITQWLEILPICFFISFNLLNKSLKMVLIIKRYR